MRIKGKIYVIGVVVLVSCAKPGKVELKKSAYGKRIGSGVTKLACPPGAQPATDCEDGGPSLYKFWVQNRKAAYAGSLSAFYEVSAVKVAVSTHYVLYRDFSASISTSQANSILSAVETNFTNLVNAYGDGKFPNIQNTNRVVILLTDILDDYNSLTNPNFIAGFFAPRDLYADSLTYALFTDPATISQYPTDFVNKIRGRSNENQILYLDYNPFLNGNAYGGDTTKAENLFKEAIIHETSHLLTYYRRNMLGGLSDHETWIAEGLAEQAPVLTAGMMENVKERLSQAARADIRAFLAVYPSLFDVETLPQPIAGLVQSHLFFEYLRHRTGSSGENLVRQEITVSNGGISGLSSVMDSIFSSTQSFASLYSDWVITNFLMMTGRTLVEYKESLSGAPVNLGSGNYPSRGYDFTYNGVSIEKVGGTGVAFLNGSLPLNYASGSKCLPPASFLYFSYTIPTGATDYNPAAEGMDSNLKLALADINTASQAKVTLIQPSDTIPFSDSVQYPVGNQYIFMVWNPLTTGSCLSTGNIRMDSRNIASWVGSGSGGTWKTDPGAYEGKNGGEYQRPSGIALYLTKKQGGINYLYAADELNWGVSRWNMDTGEFLGRMGSPITQSTDYNCTTDNSSLDGWIANTTNIYGHWCRRSFQTPKGLAVDSEGNIYVADYDNGRIVKRDKDGKFVAWLGHPTDDKWQCEPGNSFPECRNMGTADPMRFDSTNFPNQSSDVKILNRPHDVVVHEAAELETTTALVNGTYSNSDITILFDGLTTANAILPGHVISVGSEKMKVVDVTYNPDNVSGSLTVLRGILNTTASSLSDNSTISLYKSYLYVSIYLSHRIVRRNLYTGQHEGFIGNGVFNWNKTITLQSATTGTTAGYLFNPTGMALIDSGSNRYLIIADKGNHRIVRWPLDGAQDNGTQTLRFLGNSITGWHSTPSSQYGVDLYGMQYPQGVAFYNDPADGKLYLLVADTNNYRISRYEFSTGTAGGWIGGGFTEWNLGTTAPTGNPAQLLPPEFLEEPKFIVVGEKVNTGSKHDYVYVNNHFNARTVRFNLDCVFNNTGGDCSGD
ncbi:MAG: hypothetical protein D6767_05955 [Candidatus Hydrogenedentota bacterium]|nr:MAG: hypothetical protein D6767_05955 [Candidatus Hydrogenedentota bacterium]